MMKNYQLFAILLGVVYVSFVSLGQVHAQDSGEDDDKDMIDKFLDMLDMIPGVSTYYLLIETKIYNDVQT